MSVQRLISSHPPNPGEPSACAEVEAVAAALAARLKCPPVRFTQLPVKVTHSHKLDNTDPVFSFP